MALSLGHVAFHPLPRQVKSFGTLQRFIFRSLPSRHKIAASGCCLHNGAWRRLCKLDVSLESTHYLAQSDRACIGFYTSFPISIHKRILSSFQLPCHGDQKLKCECSTIQTVAFSSASKSSIMNEADKKPEVISWIETDDDFETFLIQVQSALNLPESSKTYATSMQNLRPLVQKLVSLECDPRGIHAMLVTNPGILSVRIDRLLGNIDYLYILGLNWRRLLKTLDGNALLWKASLPQLQNKIKQLRKLGLLEGQLQKVIGDWPKILTIGSAELSKVVKVLMEKCHFPKAEVVTILSDSPSILEEDLESIELRFQYAYFRMGIQTNMDMTQAKIFKYSLDHLRCRHLILERLGLYTAPDNRGNFTIQNPRLAKIIDSSDGRFAEKVAKISIQEYETFAKMLLEEVKNEKENRDKYTSLGDVEEFSDEDSQYDDDSESDDVFETEEFDFDRVDYSKKR